MQTSMTQQNAKIPASAGFYCPNCHTPRRYKYKKIAEVQIINILPIYGPKENGYLLECETCKNGFDPAIISPSNQFLFKIVAAARSQLLTTTSPGFLKAKLMSDGLKEEFVDRIIRLAQN